MTIPISQVIEQCARMADEFHPPGKISAGHAIRALAAQYEGCLVAEDTVIARKRSVEFAKTGMGAHIPHDVEIPLYRAKEPTK